MDSCYLAAITPEECVCVSVCLSVLQSANIDLLVSLMKPSNHTVTPGTGALPERSIHRFHRGGGVNVCVIDNSKSAKFNSWSGIIYK